MDKQRIKLLLFIILKCLASFCCNVFVPAVSVSLDKQGQISYVIGQSLQ